MLVERDALLGELVAAIDDALTGRGRLILVGGEAGVGKSSLVRAAVEQVRERTGVRVGRVDNIATPDAMGAFLDALPELGAVLAGPGDRVEQFRAVRETIGTNAGLLVLEDIHWSDEATFDALRFLGRRLDGMPAAIVATYRHDEVSARHPLTILLGDLAGLPGVTRLLVPPLSVEGVASLAERAGVDIDSAALRARTGGNAFFVTELLAAGGEGLPGTVNDAILARVSRMSPAGQDVAAAAATLGTVATGSLLVAVAGTDLAGLDECVDAGVLISAGDGYAFHHEVARQVVEQTLSAVRRQQLHRRALQELSARTPEDHRALAHHAAGCGDDEGAARHAALAAERAARLGAHREAAASYRLALRHGTTGDRAALFIALSYECYLTDQIPEAITARQRALELHELAGDAVAAGDDQRWLSRLSWFLGRGADAERYAARAVAVLEPSGPGRELAMALSNMAQLRMLAADRDATLEWGSLALAMATELGDQEIQAHALNNMGTAELQVGHVAEGEPMLARSLELAIALDLHEHAARAYTNLSALAVEQRRNADALRHLDDGIAYCTDRDLDSWTRYMTAWRCVLFAELGRFDEALSDAERLLAVPGLPPVTAIGAGATIARIRSRRGEDATEWLTAATDLAAETGELQRFGLAAGAAAESAWLRGDDAAIGPLTDAAWALAVSHADPWIAGELAWWRSLAGIRDTDTVELARPFALMLAGDPWAVRAWDEIGSPVWSAYAAGLGRDVAGADAAIRSLDAMGAPTAILAILRTRRARGLELPRLPRGAAKSSPRNLTRRELEILELLAEGLTNSEIAARLIISPRTAEHHITSVLRKLGEPTRARAVATAHRENIIGENR